MYSIAKRIFDILLTLAASLIAVPIGLLVALILWLTQRTVLFRQIRPGLRARPFVLYKFCSMNSARDDQGRLLPDEQRLTPFGSRVRSLSLDEIPQLWNVLKGDMSLVGPRPLLMEYLARYSSEQARRHEVKPGITGWAQINGRNSLTWNQKFALDIWYVDHASFLLDLKIILLTIPRVLGRSGISSPRNATGEEFLGNDFDA